MRTQYPALTSYSLRAGGIRPVQPIPDAPFIVRTLSKAILPIFSAVAPSIVNKTDVLARAMIESVLKGGSGEIEGWKGKGAVGNENTFESPEINTLAQESVLSK